MRRDLRDGRSESARRGWPAFSRTTVGRPQRTDGIGFGFLTVPKGDGRRLLGDLLGREEHAERVRELGDDADLATT